MKHLSTMNNYEVWNSLRLASESVSAGVHCSAFSKTNELIREALLVRQTCHICRGQVIKASSSEQ